MTRITKRRDRRTAVQSNHLDRRAFSKVSASAVLALGVAEAASAAVPPNDRIGVGFIGVGNRGSQVLDAFLEQPNIEIVALCDVYQPYLDRAQARFEHRLETCRDYRHLIERQDVDGVVIDTVSATGFMDENPGEMKVVGQLTSDEQLGFVFPPDSELRAAVDAALQAMIDSGALDEFNQKWGLSE